MASERTGVVVLLADGAVLPIYRFDARQRPPDLALVERLARLHVAARRRGWSVVVRGGTPEHLRELVELLGLSDVLGDVLGPPPPCDGEPIRRTSASGPELGGQAEGGEELGVEEVVEPRDPPT